MFLFQAPLPVFLPPTIEDFEIVFSNVVLGIIGLGAFVFFIMIVIGGFKFLSAGSDQKANEMAKKTLTNAILGFILMLASFLILRIIENFTGFTTSTITNFDVVR